MNESSRTVSGIAELLVVRVSAAMNSFQAAMKVKISAVTRPGAASGRVTRSSTPIAAAAVHHRRLLDLGRDRGEVGVHDPDRERHVEARVHQDQSPHRVDQVEAEELLVDADDQRGRLEHLGGQHEYQESPAAPETVPGRVIGRGQRNQRDQDGRAAGHLEADPQAGGDAEARAPHAGQVRPGPVVRQVVTVQQFPLRAQRGDQHLQVGEQEDDGDQVGGRRDDRRPDGGEPARPPAPPRLRGGGTRRPGAGGGHPGRHQAAPARPQLLIRR